MAKGIIRVTARAILHSMLQLSDYELLEARVELRLNGSTDLVFIVTMPELPGREDTTVTLEPVYESMRDGQDRTWYHLKEVKVV